VVVLERLFPGGSIKPSFTDRFKGAINKVRPGQEWTNPVAPSHFKATIQQIPGFRVEDKAENAGMCEASVLFADIDGIDAWNAGRESKDKCDLMDMVHRTFRMLAKKHGISQIDMSGECFVVIKGSKGVDDNHAAALTHFACDCRKTVGEKFKALQARGIAIRFGIHTGHVQQGEVGEERSRYQLVGDTIDIAYQMLSSSRAGKIHISVDTAELLNLAGKGDWLVPREDLVLVKGKGEMSTFWIRHKACLASSEPPDLLWGSDASSQASVTSFDDIDNWESQNMAEFQTRENKFQAVIERTVQVLLPYLKKIQAKRNAQKTLNASQYGGSNDVNMDNSIIDEARDVLLMPPFDSRVAALMTHSEMLDLPEEVEEQLRLYITSIVSTYKPNDFHNIEHAAHVCLTMDKMIKKLLAPESQDVYVDFGGKPRSAESIAFDLENRSFGLASDPLAQFSLLFASLVHDVDHVGVSNQQLIKEGSPIASLYRNQSVAEQNSVDISWWLLMTPNFADLRTAIYENGSEMQRFRQILVNTIIATDVMDRDMKIHRDSCWKKSFEGGGSKDISPNQLRDLKATMIAEHLMQAADHSHTMQSYRNFLKWNQRLFDETCTAYHAGRAEKDPTTWWYVGELAFFDKFVIPLTLRLKESGVFGSSGQEYLNNALQNRKLWASNGKKIVHDMKERFNRRVVSAQHDTIEFYTD
jgi:class 3 adenylate cyclase